MVWGTGEPGPLPLTRRVASTVCKAFWRQRSRLPAPYRLLPLFFFLRAKGPEAQPPAESPGPSPQPDSPPLSGPGPPLPTAPRLPPQISLSHRRTRPPPLLKTSRCHYLPVTASLLDPGLLLPATSATKNKIHRAQGGQWSSHPAPGKSEPSYQRAPLYFPISPFTPIPASMLSVFPFVPMRPPGDASDTLSTQNPP